MIAASAAPFYLPSACFPDADSTLMRRRSAPASQGAECCKPGSASQFWRALARCQSCVRCGRPARSVELRTRARRGREFCFCCGSHSLALPTASACEWPAHEYALEAAGAQSLLDRARAIGAVAEHVRRRVALSQEFVQLLAVVHRRIGHLVAPDQLVLGIRIHVVLVSEKTPAMPLRPARVAVLLAQFGRPIIPLLRYPTSLHRLVLIATVALRRNRHNRGINHLPTTRHVAFGSEVLVEAVE